jgi:photosystem II cytochrome c550
MPNRILIRCLLTTLIVCWSWVIGCLPVHAAVDNYVARYLKVTEPVPVKLNEQGATRLFTPEDVSSGKRFFEKNCLNCHVGGATLPNPMVSLSLTALSGATPPRDNVDNFVAYMRQPMVYDGSEVSFWCREVPDSWLSQTEVENLAAFVLRAAEKAPGWGTDTF